MTTFNLPDLGEGLQDAEIVSWHVAAGDHIVADQPLVSVETEKAVVEIPSPQAGYVARLLARPGERVQVGAPLMSFEDGPHEQAGTVVGDLPGTQPPQPPPPTTPTPTPSPTPTREPSATAGAVRAAPAVRVRAQALGVDLARVSPTGPSGTVTLADVEAAASAGAGAPVMPLRGARRTMASNMARAWREVVHATLFDEADVGGWSGRGDVTARLVRAVVAGCAREPLLNAGFDAASSALRSNAVIDVGLAIDGPDGLLVPVLRNVGMSDADDLRKRIDAAKAGVRDRSLSPADLRGATITLSNFGTIAGRHAALIILPPQVAILGAGRISELPTAAGPPHRRLPLSLTFDHRAISGGEAARFLHAVITDLARPV